MIVKRHGKWMLVSKSDPDKVLGVHDTKEQAVAQERAINISKALKEEKK